MPPQSPSPPISSLQNKGAGAENGQPRNVDQQNAGEDIVKQSSKASVFANSEPMREEQVQNAVKFLSHPKVRGSPVIYRRSFLEKKGLTKEEIDEAFRRVPDSPPSEQTAGGNQELKPTPDIQRQAQPQALQLGISGATGVTTSLRTSSRFSFRWSHALVAVGLLVASGAGTAMLIKKSILPRLKSWIRNIVLEEEDDQLKRTDSKPTLAEEAAKAATAAAAAAADMAKASQEILTSKSEERRYIVEVVNLLDKQVQEMKLMTNEIRRLEASSGVSLLKREDHQITQTSSKPLIVNGKGDYDLRSVRSTSPPASVEPSSAPHPKSYMEIMAMIQRGEKPSNIRDIDDSPPNPNQQPTNPRLAPRTKPWEVGQVQHNSTAVFQSQVNGKDSNFKVQDNGHRPVPWWQANNVRVREVDNGIENNGAPYGAASSQQPVQHAWVPPQPPPIAMLEAAEAIRHPKPPVQRGQTADDQSVAHSSGISDKEERISELSKSEGAIDGSSADSHLRSAEALEVS